ncbi:siderophore-interacting protein [Microbacterium sp. Root61]|uniref:siderophore-interacting protein n=1 Tax=Microbacterium sp. Root61 TaxID=1736570 RepID=UPI0009EAC90D|nr:siderophore-interacting protein [Microbacterium sp. Root61]
MTDAATTPVSAGRAGRPPADTTSPFFRAGGRNRFTARPASVVAVSTPAPDFVRVTLTGPDFADFVSGGPSDHIRLFLPDPATGELVAPAPVGPDEDGIIRPEGQTFSRDFTPLAIHTLPDGAVAVDVDFFLHADAGPASGWAARASVGDSIVVVGPRGSKAAPQGVSRAVLICDETSLPSVARWVRELPPTARIDIIAALPGSGDWVADYLGVAGSERVAVHVVAPEATEAALDALDPIDAGTYVWAAGEASALVPLRRHLRRTLGLPSEQASVSGYWRSGVVGFDHHSPVDPSDPD